MELAYAYAQINTGRVVVAVSNLSGPVADPLMIPISVYDESLLGKVYDAASGLFQDAPPLPPGVPPVVSMRQARLALHAVGKLAGVTSAIDAMTDPDQQTVARIEWEYAPMVERASAFVALLGAAVGLDDEAVDDLFRAAIQL